MAGDIGLLGDKIYKDLLIIDSIRGPHSTGSLFVGKVGNTKVVKTPGDPFVLLENNIFQTHLRYQNKVLMGHNRYATKGAINKVNAHPFEFENLIGAHNGTLTKQALLDDSKDFAVDSENIYHHMSKNGIQDTATKLCGAYALTWYDKGEGSINFLRNVQRTLYYTYSDNGKTLFWASEPWMLSGILSKHCVNHGDITSFTPDFHYKLVVGAGSGVLPELTVEKVTPYTPPKAVVKHGTYIPKETRTKLVPFTGGEVYCQADNDFSELGEYLGKEIYFYPLGYSHGSGGNKMGYVAARMSSKPSLRLRVMTTEGSRVAKMLLDSDGFRFVGTLKRTVNRSDVYGVIETRTIRPAGIGHDVESDDVEDGKEFLGFGGELLTESEWEYATKNCCAWCASPADINEHRDLAWVADSEFVCPECAELDDVKHYILK